MIDEQSAVALTADLPMYGPCARNLGTVVLRHHKGKGDTVEFTTLKGDTIAEATLLADQV